MQFRLINSGSNNGFMNMAIDEALLTSKKPVLRFYSWKPACLSIGKYQDINQINVDYCKKNGIDIVRRISGGNAVLHENEITYSFIIDEDELPESVIESYKIISRGILKGLKLLGIKAEMNEEVEKKDKSDVCFNDPSWYEILVDGKKIIGSAQKRVNGKILQHGSLLITLDVDKYLKCFKKGFDKNRITWLKNYVDVDYEKMVKILIQGYEEDGMEFEKSRLSDEEKELAERLVKKYSKL